MRPAVIEDDRMLSYTELDNMADSIMAKFYDSKPDFVGIVMHHGAEQIAAMLAVLKSGAAYVPAEPSLPQERIDYMMQTAGVKMIITDNYCRNLIPPPMLWITVLKPTVWLTYCIPQELPANQKEL